MPPKKKETDASAAEPRRSSRVASQPAKPAPEPKAKAAPKKAPASKKRAAEDEPATSGDADEEAATKPASKKPKSTTEKKAPASKKQANGDDDKKETNGDADKVDKPKSAVTKPQSKKANSKPESKKAPASKEAPASKKQDNGDIPEETEEGADAENEVEAPSGAKADTGGVKEIADGDVLPSVTVQDNKGQDVDVSTLCDSDHGLVIFVYPKANTPGCTTQACSYRDSYEEFEKLGYKVFGLSADTVAAQDKWATTKEFKYNLLADTKHELLKILGAFVPPKNIKRSHFIFEKGTGKLIEKKVGVKPADDTKNALSFIQSHHK